MVGANQVIFILIAVLVAFLLVLFQYGKEARKGGIYLWLAILRFFGIFCILFLIISPKYKKETFYTEKPNLSILMDNSASIHELGFDSVAKNTWEKIANDKELNDKFSISSYVFDAGIEPLNKLSFNGKQTNITKALNTMSSINRKSQGAVLLFSDGNQTYGADYQYLGNNYKTPVYPIVVGDSTTYSDLKIAQLNVNKYAYFKNKFPVEVFLDYEGKDSITSTFKIIKGKQVLFSKKLSFDKNNTSQVINTQLLANSIGIQTMQAVIVPLANEKNKVNNQKLFAMEVIDQKNNVAIVTDVLHPDIGALKKIIESNEFRKADIIDVRNFKAQQDNSYQLYVLYQPNVLFKPVFQELNNRKANFWIITGMDTDWNFLNTQQLGFNNAQGRGDEEITPAYNQNFQTFQTEDIGFDDFPPLKSTLDEISFMSPGQTLLFKKISNVPTSYPLLTVMENQDQKKALFLGEGIWKWRAANYVSNEKTEAFDAYFGKLIQFLSSKKQRERLTVAAESFYYGNSQVLLSASYFDENYVFDPDVSIEIITENRETNQKRTFSMLYGNNSYQANLNTLQPGTYNFTVRVPSANISKSGSFTILDFNVEQQFVNPDIERLNILANNTNGKIFYLNDFQKLKNELLDKGNYQAVQKSMENVVPLIDWKWLLAVIILAFSSEWFLRKYSGLI
ncbi:VWA domain-containing protein [Galbibacter sp. PAP.153]|uniref:VWA domain-containing protein n=1 Tax=Galbibacter sp. PAP.153 TaxID=3104623 RepID=UPI00300BB33D